MSIPYGTLRDIANELKNIREILEKRSAIEVMEYPQVEGITSTLVIIEQSSKIGNWIADRYCSKCGWDKKEASYATGWRENFCPDCGARMEG